MTLIALLSTFLNNLLPIILITGAGYLLGKFLSVDTRTVGRVVFYLLSPLLIFNLLITNQLPYGDIFQTMAFATAVVVLTGLLTLGFSLVMRLERTVISAILITSMFANGGNYGLPLVSFAFGKDALAFASIYFVTTSILFNTLGVLIASLGRMDLKRALLGLLRVPTIYAVVIALLLNQFSVQLPIYLERTITLGANGAIPMMLILLGLELQRAQWTKNISSLSLSTALRLVAGPVIGILLAGLFGSQGAARQANIIQSAMPSAVFNTVLATEYELDTSLVTATVFISTVLSPLTLTPMLVFLGN